MGNADSQFIRNDENWEFVGRCKDLEQVKKRLAVYRIVEIFGIAKIGKSRLMKKIIRDLLDEANNKRTLLYWDFSGRPDLLKCFNKGLESLDEKIQLVDFQSVSEMAEIFLNATKSANQELIVFLDNLNELSGAQHGKDDVLSFINSVTDQSEVSFVITTNVKIGLTRRQFTSYEIDVMSEDDILNLLYVVTEWERKNDEQDIYMRTIAKLCEGLPLAAMVAACELKADDGFLEPSEMVEILIDNRLTALSPDIYPPEEKLTIYTHAIDNAKALAPYFRYFLEEIAKSAKTNTISVDEANQAAEKADTGTVTTAQTKKWIVRLKQSGVFTKLGAGKFDLHGAFYECIQAEFLLQDIRELPKDKRCEHEEKIYKAMRLNLDKAGIKATDDDIKDPKRLEQLIKNMVPPKEDEHSCQSDDDLIIKQTNESHPFSVEYPSDKTPEEHSDVSTMCSSSNAGKNSFDKHSEDKILNIPFEDMHLNIQLDSLTDNSVSSVMENEIGFAGCCSLNSFASFSGPAALSWQDNVT